MGSRSDIDIPLKAAEKHAKEGRLTAAAAEYRKVLRVVPNDLNVLNSLGDLYVRLGKIEDAITCFMKVADGYLADGSEGSGFAVFKKVAKLAPDRLDIGLSLAELYAKRGKRGDAIQQFREVAELARKKGKLNEWHEALKRAADTDMSNVTARLELAEICQEHGFDHEAFDAYRIAGLELVRQERYAEGVEPLTKALDLRPDSKAALKSLAEAHALAGDVSSALNIIARSLEVDPNDIDLIVILGRTFLNAGMLEKAEATFDRLYRLDNSRYDYLLEVARAYVDTGEYNQTMAIVDRCIDIMLARRHKKKATALLKEILTKDPGNILALKRLAGIYKNVREKRNLVNTLNTLVQAALIHGMRAEAAVALRQLIEIEPTKSSYQKKLDEISESKSDELSNEKGLVLLSDELEFDSLDSYGDYSTELLEEMVAQHPEFLRARLKLLEDLVTQQPAYIEGHLKLKQHYLDLDEAKNAAKQCLALAQIYEDQGDSETARRYRHEAGHIDPSINIETEGDGNKAKVKGATAPKKAPEPKKGGDEKPAQSKAEEPEAAVDVPEELGAEFVIVSDDEPVAKAERPRPKPAAKAEPPKPEPAKAEAPKPEPAVKAEPSRIDISILLGLEDFEKYFDWEWRRALRTARPMSLLKVSVDRLASYREELGDEDATRCLEHVAGVVELALVQAGQLFALVSDSEFFVLLPDAHPNAASATADTIRAEVEALGLPHPNGSPITVSLGVATGFPYRLSTPEPLVVSIDESLLKAQRSGGNRVVAAPLLGA